MAGNSMITIGGRCILKPPFFNGTNYIDWKEDMKIFIQSVDVKLWFIIKNGRNIPRTFVEGREVEIPEDELDEEDINSLEQDSRAKHMLYCAVNFEAYKRILQYKTAKEMWDKLENSHGNNVYYSSMSETYNSATNSELPPISYPNNVFFEETREAMNKYLKYCVPLHKHALQGNWKEAKAIIDQDHRLKNAAIAKGLTTVLHVAASARGGAKHVHFVKQLMEEFLNDEDLLLLDNNGNTAFCLAAAAGNMQVLNLMKNKNPTVVEVRGVDGTCPPVQFAALQGRCDVAWSLYENTRFRNDELKRLFLTCINNGLYGLALKMATDHPSLAFAKDDKNGETVLHILARHHLDSYCQSRRHQIPIIKINPGMKQQVVFQLVKKLWRTILAQYTMQEITDTRRFNPFQLLFAAVEVGNFGFLSEILSVCPYLIWTKDDTNQTIIHKAVMHRHASIFNLIHEIGSITDIIVTMVDRDGNTLLHLAARRAPHQRQLELVSGAAFQMCLEVVWFKEVKKIMQPWLWLINYKNSDGKTARELFSEEHEELRKDAESWMKSTAENCMLIATVIATGVFAAAITVPGGVDDKGGKPNYLGKTSWFLVFAISDATAFISSAASILIFLSILVSRYAEKDFYRSLPLKLIFGLVALFCSITSMMVAFASAFFITYHHSASYLVPIFISIFASLPALLFLVLQSSLWSDLMYSTVFCRKLKPGKKMLYVLEELEIM